METEFRYLPFDQIRYSMVWEGQSSLYQALEPQPGDELLVICSGGCNVLNTLLTPAEKVWAVDLNPLQIKLLDLKCRVIERFPYDVFSGLMGFDGEAGMASAAKQVLADLSENDRQFWEPLFVQYPQGLLLAGRLEAYICQFYTRLSSLEQGLMDALFAAQRLEDQADIFGQLQQTDFKTTFIEYFSRQQLSKGRDERLFKYTRDPGGERFYERLCRYLQQHLLGESYISRFFFYGPADMPMHLRPACYQAQNHSLLRQSFGRLQRHTGEAIDFLNSEAGSRVTKASLSNIFEYTSPEVFAQTVHQLLQRPQLRFVYWNLLNNQGKDLLRLPSYLARQSALLSAREDCFYFDALHVFETHTP